MAEKMITVCTWHPGYVTPLIWTFAFPGAEWWCPYCGFTCGMFGSTNTIPFTLELAIRHDAYKAKYKNYLCAMGVLSCVSVLQDGVQTRPEDLSDEVKAQYKQDRQSWKDYMEIEKETKAEGNG